MPVSKADMQKRLDEMHAKLKTDVKGALEYFADDAKMLAPHHDAITSKAEMLKLHQAKKEKDPKSDDFDLKATVVDVLEIGDAVIVDGTTVITVGGKEFDRGKFLNIYKKVGGDYKIIRSMANTSKPMEMKH